MPRKGKDGCSAYRQERGGGDDSSPGSRGADVSAVEKKGVKISKRLKRGKGL